MAFWSNFQKNIEKAKKAVGTKIKTTKRDFEEGLDTAKYIKEEMFPTGTNWRNFKTGLGEVGGAVKTPFQDLKKTLTPDKSQGNISDASVLGATKQPDITSILQQSPKGLPPITWKNTGKTLSELEYERTHPNETPKTLEKGMKEILTPTSKEKLTIGQQQGKLIPGQQPREGQEPQYLPTEQPKTEPVSPEYDLISSEGQKKIAEAEEATGLKGVEALRAMRGEKPTQLETGLKDLGVSYSGEIETTPAFQESVKKATIGISDPDRAETIKTEIKGIQEQIATLQWQLDRMPGVTPSDKDAYKDLMDTWAEGGASADDIAKIVDNMTRADDDMISNQIMPTYKKYLETPAITKAKNTMEDLYEKYSTTETELNDLFTEAEKAINAIKQSPYLTQSMIVGRMDKMRDEYNMEINTKQNQLNSLGKDIDRGRSALKDLTTEGFKMAEIEIGSLELGIQEDILGKTGLGWESVAKMLKGKESGKAPETIGAGRFQYGDSGWEQATPFAPKTPTAAADKQAITQDHYSGLQQLIGGDGFVSLDAFIEMAQAWMLQTGIYDPSKYRDMFGQKYLSPDDLKKFMNEMTGEGGYSLD